METVELRRRPLKLSVGCRVWIYCTLPRGAVEAIGIVSDVVVAAPSAIWRNYGKQCGISKAEFDFYYDGVDTAYVIVFSSVKKLPSAFTLDEIRRHFPRFQPPQFFKRLLAGGPELSLFTSKLPFPVAA
jgi:predicted transcriptional regulator